MRFLEDCNIYTDLPTIYADFMCVYERGCTYFMKVPPLELVPVIEQPHGTFTDESNPPRTSAGEYLLKS